MADVSPHDLHAWRRRAWAKTNQDTGRYRSYYQLLVRASAELLLGLIGRLRHRRVVAQRQDAPI